MTKEGDGRPNGRGTMVDERMTDDDFIRIHDLLERDDDAVANCAAEAIRQLRADLAKAEADAAVMRKALVAADTKLEEWRRTLRDAFGYGGPTPEAITLVRAALATNSGTALLNEVTALRARVAETEALLEYIDATLTNAEREAMEKDYDKA